MNNEDYCKACWFPEVECACADCTVCSKEIPPAQQYGDDRYPSCPDCVAHYESCVQDEKQMIALENKHIPTNIDGTPMKGCL